MTFRRSRAALRLVVALLPIATACVVPNAAAQDRDSGYGRTLLGNLYWCPGGNCLAGRRRMAKADPASFRALTGGYALDRNRVWFEGREVPAADPYGWQVLEPGFGRDQIQVFVGRHAVPGLDPATTRWLPRHYLADDRKAVYGEFQGERAYLRFLDGVIVERLALLPVFGDTLASDGVSLFLAGERLPVTLAEDFQVLWSSYQTGTAFVSDGALHLLARQRGHDPRSLAERVPTLTLGPLRRFDIRWQGDGDWGLAEGHLLVVVHDGDLLVLREGVSTLQRLPGTAFHAVVDGYLLFRHPNRPPELLDLGPAQDDLTVLDAWRVRNGGQVWDAGKPSSIDSAAPALESPSSAPKPRRQR